MAIIELKNLSKKFGDLTAVNDVSFEVKEGQIFGFLGPNGAGKTTTISMLATLINPTSGNARVNGFDIVSQRDNVRKSIGIVFQDPSLDDELTAFENMDFHGRLYNVPDVERKQKIEALLKLVELDDRKNDLVKTFSGGMKRRLEIARGLLHEPKVLFLDEPTLGLDPQTRNHLWEYIKALNEKKHITIILTTHYMDEADRLCDVVSIIDHGKIIALDAPQKLKNSIGGSMISIKTSKSIEASQLLEKFKGVKNVKLHDGVVDINIENAEKMISEIVTMLSKKNISIESINIHTPTLEDVFLYFTGKTIREEEGNSKDAMRLAKRMWRR